jgi:hypothetical protein
VFKELKALKVHKEPQARKVRKGTLVALLLNTSLIPTRRTLTPAQENLSSATQTSLLLQN